jgi:hypothetical protein
VVSRRHTLQLSLIQVVSYRLYLLSAHPTSPRADRRPGVLRAALYRGGSSRDQRIERKHVTQQTRARARYQAERDDQQMAGRSTKLASATDRIRVSSRASGRGG